MKETQRFKAVIEDAGGGGAFVRVPFEVEEVYGQKRPKIRALIHGEPYRGTLVRMGTQGHILGILKEIREKIGKTFGDEVEVVLEEDTEPRVAQVPADFQSALDADPPAKAAFERMSYTHQKEYVRSIEEAKQADTRRKRIEKNLDLLKKSGKDG